MPHRRHSSTVSPLASQERHSARIQCAYPLIIADRLVFIIRFCHLPQPAVQQANTV